MPAIDAFGAGTATFTVEKLRAHRRQAMIVRISASTLATVVLALAWQVTAYYNRPWLPLPLDTLESMQTALMSSRFYTDMAITSLRLVEGFLAATIFGFLIGIAIGFNRSFEAFAAPLVAIALAVPDPVYVIFASLALNTGELASFAALVLAVMPFVINVVHAGIGARDRTLDEMARVYRISSWNHFRHSIIPQLVPSLLTATRFSFALSWKVVILVEALTRPDGVGARIYNYFHVLRMRDAIAQAIIFCIVMQLVECLIFSRAEKRLMRWRS